MFVLFPRQTHFSNGEFTLYRCDQIAVIHRRMASVQAMPPANLLEQFRHPIGKCSGLDLLHRETQNQIIPTDLEKEFSFTRRANRSDDDAIELFRRQFLLTPDFEVRSLGASSNLFTIDVMNDSLV